MPKRNAVLMVVLAAAVIAATGILAFRSTPASDDPPARAARLLRKLADPDPEIRLEGEVGLRSMGSRALRPLLEASSSSDRVLAARASKLLSDLQPPVAGPPPPQAPAAPAQAQTQGDPEEFSFEILCSGAPEQAQRMGVYLVQLRNRGKTPVLVVMPSLSEASPRLAWFEVEDRQGRTFQVDAKPMPGADSAGGVIPVLPGSPRGLFGGWETLPPLLFSPDVRSVRFVYDASLMAYREAARKAGAGALLPPVRLASRTYQLADAR